MAKEKKIQATSPIGQANWFKLVKPDPKFNKYSVDLIVEDSDQIQTLLNQIEELTAERLSKAKQEAKNPQAAVKMKDSGNRPIEKQLDSEGKHTGKYIMKFRASSTGTKKDGETYVIAPPSIFNNKGVPLSSADKNALQVPNGSRIQVAFELSAYFVQASGAGVTLKPKAVKIHKIESVADINQFGFSESEFSSQDDSDSEDFSSESSSGAESNDESDSDF